MLFSATVLLFLARCSLAINFDWEKTQLSESEASDYPAIQFGSSSKNAPKECKIIPGDPEWPSDADWAKFNETLDGALMKPRPLASPCYEDEGYDEEICARLRQGWTNMGLHTNNPISVMSQWSSGYSCVPTSNASSTCSQGGYPVYVVNARTARHIQLAVNFARNQNIRLVIKNSGHEFNGKSVGGHALSVWTHNLKDMTYHPKYSAPGGYTGRAVAYSAGYQALDANTAMARYDMTMINAGGPTVGIAGGFLQGGGHSSYTSFYGLAVDQILRITAVTADGRLVEASDDENEDLFWAFRGGGGGTYGIITSVVVKAFPRTPISSGSISFSTVPSSSRSTPQVSLETFWEGLKAYWDYCIAICDQGGLGYNFIRHTTHPSDPSVSGFTFTTNIRLPNHTASEYREFVRPLLETLNDIGVPLPVPRAMEVKRYYNVQDQPPTKEARTEQQEQQYNNMLDSRALGDPVGHTQIASRFFLRSNYNTPSALSEMHNAIRHLVETGGYTFHGMNYAPTLSVANHANTSVHPAFRDTIMHTQAYEGDAWWDTLTPQVPIAELKERHDRLQSYMQGWRDVTPGSGSYINEGDAQEPDFKEAFWGANYERLLGLKKKYDPEGVFWAIGAVGSDEWKVVGGVSEGVEGYVTQDGRLCRA